MVHLSSFPGHTSSRTENLAAAESLLLQATDTTSYHNSHRPDIILTRSPTSTRVLISSGYRQISNYQLLAIADFPQVGTHPTSTRLVMCMWEKIIYACGHQGRPRRVEYSCVRRMNGRSNRWRRYGCCRYNGQGIYQLFSRHDCDRCADYYEFINWEG